jgi:hypothetical protein
MYYLFVVRVFLRRQEDIKSVIVDGRNPPNL